MAATPTPPQRPPRRRLWAILAAVLALVVIVVVVIVAASGGSTSSHVAKLPKLHPRRTGPETMFTGSSVATYTPGNLDVLRALGVDRVHIYMHWADIAPDPTSSKRPDFDAADPAAYPAAGWAPYDQAISDITARGMSVDLDLVPPPPNWAEGPGAPDPKSQPEWKPSAAQFGLFVRAVGTRYSGHYRPAGGSALPHVKFWSIWNEPDLGIELAPEAIDHSKVEVAPRYYRAIVDEAWRAFGATGHGRDTILIGELAPAGIRSGAGVGNFNSMPPLRFMRALYCVDSSLKPLSGAAASVRGCPPTAAGSKAFPAQHPGLFKASGIADHPYPQGLPPDEATPNEPDYAELASLPHVESVLDRIQRAYGSNTKFSIWSTEFGYQTTPPDTEAGTVTPERAALYLNWAEYLTWSDPRQKSYDQYLLTDPPAGNFATGILTDTGAVKPGFVALRMPLFIPQASTTRGRALVVWGGVRPAHVTEQVTHKRQVVLIQFQADGKVPFRTVRRVPIIDRHGYFEVRQTFPGSGNVRLAWTPPQAATDYSRVAAVTVR